MFVYTSVCSRYGDSSPWRPPIALFSPSVPTVFPHPFAFLCRLIPSVPASPPVSFCPEHYSVESNTYIYMYVRTYGVNINIILHSHIPNFHSYDSPPPPHRTITQFHSFISLRLYRPVPFIQPSPTKTICKSSGCKFTVFICTLL